MMEMEDQELLDLDNTCPHCGDYCADDEVYDGQFFGCASCGKRVRAVAWSNGTMSMTDAEPAPPRRLTGHKKTMALRRRRGWR